MVFCNTLGFEGTVAHRAFRHLADDLTARGFWSVRFDYAGEGDSTGGPWEPDRIAAWIESVDAAVDMLRARGVDDIRLVGFRVGASLAHLYATTHAGVTGLVLWAPCVKGSAYIREMRALSRLSAAARPVQRVQADWFPEDSLEVGGFEFGAEALAGLADVDLVTAPWPVRPPAVLVIDRTDAPASEELVGKFVKSGSRVDHERMPGYTEFMTDDEVTSVLPWPTLHRVVEWIDSAEPAELDALAFPLESDIVETQLLSIAEPSAGRLAPPGPAHGPIVEEQVWIGGRLFAIVSSPTGAAGRRASIVCCNTGLINRIGPGRLYVDLARYWASIGFTVVRLDLGGAGDSISNEPRSQNQPHAPRRIDELREVVAWIRERTGVDSVVLFGLCSGAYNALHAAIEGVDVNHSIMVNPGLFYLGDDQTVFASAEVGLGAAHLLSRGLTSPRKWGQALREPGQFRLYVKRARRLFGEGATDGVRFVLGAFVRNNALRVGLNVKSPSPLPGDLDEITARGVRVLMVFATGESGAQYVRRIAGRAFAKLLRSDRVELVEINGGDHLFSAAGARQRLFEVTTQYLEREYPISSPQPTVVRPAIVASDLGPKAANDT